MVKLSGIRAYFSLADSFPEPLFKDIAAGGGGSRGSGGSSDGDGDKVLFFGEGTLPSTTFLEN